MQDSYWHSGGNIAKAKSLVFGINTKGDEDNLVFIPEVEAKRLSAIYEATSAKTWGEFTRLMPAADLEEIVAWYIEDERDIPSDDAKFQVELLPGYCDGDWPDWAEQKMLDWVPRSIIEKFATMMPTGINGSYPVLDASRKEEIVAAMRAAGFECRADGELVRNACGL